MTEDKDEPARALTVEEVQARITELRSYDRAMTEAPWTASNTPAVYKTAPGVTDVSRWYRITSDMVRVDDALGIARTRNSLASTADMLEALRAKVQSHEVVLRELENMAATGNQTAVMRQPNADEIRTALLRDTQKLAREALGNGSDLTGKAMTAALNQSTTMLQGLVPEPTRGTEDARARLDVLVAMQPSIAKDNDLAAVDKARIRALEEGLRRATACLEASSDKSARLLWASSLRKEFLGGATAAPGVGLVRRDGMLVAIRLGVKDPTAQDLLWQFAQRRRRLDAQFSNDLETALRTAGYSPGPDLSPLADEHVDRLTRLASECLSYRKRVIMNADEMLALLHELTRRRGPGSGQPGPAQTQQGAATPDQGASPAVGNVEEPQSDPTGQRVGHPPSRLSSRTRTTFHAQVRARIGELRDVDAQLGFTADMLEELLADAMVDVADSLHFKRLMARESSTADMLEELLGDG